MDTNKETQMNHKVFDHIRLAQVAHVRDMDEVPVFSAQYYYAKMMAKRCAEALSMTNPDQAWKHFIGV